MLALLVVVNDGDGDYDGSNDDRNDSFKLP